MVGEVSQLPVLVAVMAVMFFVTRVTLTPLTRSADLVASGRGVINHPRVNFSNLWSTYRHAFDDLDWEKQWYVQDTHVMDLHLLPVYRMGITGKNVVVAVIEDGVDSTHPDLAERFRHDLSDDLCKMTGSSSPYDKRDVYGTMAAGIIAMQANNGECGVGVAYDAMVAGVRFYCPRQQSLYEAHVIGYRINDIDISLNLWGGAWLQRHDAKTDEAFGRGIQFGLRSKGVIYVFTGGTNGNKGSNCGGNSLLQVPEVIVVNGASHIGKRLSYGERCSAIMVTAYAFEADGSSLGLVTTSTGGSCGVHHVPGTWAAGAFAAGVIALVLEARRELTHRDVMHIIAMGAEVAPLAENDNTWHRNAKGFWVSNDFGFGLLNAENMVNLARKWVVVPPKNVCRAKAVFEDPLVFDFGQTKTVKFHILGCKENNNAVNYLEHVVVWLNVSYKHRGSVRVSLVSPRGTDTTIMEQQPADTEVNGLINWRVTSLHSWGESPKGAWRLRVATMLQNESLDDSATDGAKVTIDDFEVELHGTDTSPEYYGRLPRQYAEFHLVDGRSSEDPLPKNEDPKDNYQQDEEITAEVFET